MGAHKEALRLILEVLCDVKGAIDFVKAQGTVDGSPAAAEQAPSEELWHELLDRAMRQPAMVELVVSHVAAEPIRSLDTVELVRRLPPDLPFGGASLHAGSATRLLEQAVSEVHITSAAVTVGEADCMRLLRERHELLQRPKLVASQPHTNESDHVPAIPHANTDTLPAQYLFRADVRTPIQP
jgi:hypothetical protein